ncbi:MAG: hypothetical protein ACREMV_13805 [Gemmatimonadales bacterium]
MPLSQVKIQPEGGVLSVDVAIGHGQIGAFQLTLFDAEGANPVDVGKGVNTDNVPDDFEIPVPPANVNGQILLWTIQVASPSGGGRERYSTDVRIRQGGTAVRGGKFSKEGALGAQAVLVTGMARLVAAS